MSDPTRPTVSPVPSRRSGVRKVLLADDEETLCKALARVLRAADFEVVIATDGSLALEAIVSGGFDVIVCDVHMPGATGIDLLRVVRAYDLDVPVILMTGDPDIEPALEAMELGA